MPYADVLTADKEAPEWTTVESLKGTRLGALIQDLREQQLALDDAEKRVKALKKLIQPLVIDLPFSVRALDRTVAWMPPQETRRLDPQLLVAAGVLPDQLAKGWKVGVRSGYVTMRKVKIPESASAIGQLLSETPPNDSSQSETPPLPETPSESVGCS